MAGIEDLIHAARSHGDDSEPEHEVGDLQDLLRAMWSLLSDRQRAVYQTLPATTATMQAGGAPFTPSLLPDRAGLVEVFDLHGEHPAYPRTDWAREAAEQNAQRGYWDWVEASIERDFPRARRCAKAKKYKPQ